MKSHLAIETTRSKQIETLKSTYLKSDLNTLSNVVSRTVTGIRLCTERTESEKSLGVTNVKKEFRESSCLFYRSLTSDFYVSKIMHL